MTNELLLDSYASKTCTYALHLQNTELAENRLPPSVLAQRRMQRGIEFEQAVGDYLNEIAPEDALLCCPLDCARDVNEEQWAADRSRRLQMTLDAMAMGTRVIWNPRLPPDPLSHRSGEPDVLVCVDQLSTPPRYIPVDVKAHHALSRSYRSGVVQQISNLFNIPKLTSYRFTATETDHYEDLLQLSHYWKMLEACEHAPDSAPYGVIIGTPIIDGDIASVICFSLEEAIHDYGDAFDDALSVVVRAREIANGSTDKGLGVPWYTTNCNDCGWRGVCGPQMIARRDVSLVRPSRHIFDDLDYFEITTIDELAAIDLSAIRPNGTTVTSSAPWRDARHRARMALGGDPVPFALHPDLVNPSTPSPILWRRQQSDHGEWSLPSGDVELDIDMECTTSHAYLWGTFLTYGKGIAPFAEFAEGYRGFGDTYPADITASEGDIFMSFWEFVTTLRNLCEEQGRSFRAYCYSSAENKWMRQCADRIDRTAPHPISLRDRVEEFIASPDWVDLYREMKFRVESLNGLSLKNVAKSIGFSWRAADAGGEASMAWYEDAINAQGEGERRAWRQQILEYNEDDVRATLYLRQWFAAHPPEALPMLSDNSA